MRRTLIPILAAACIQVSEADPPTMDIGYIAIDNYAGNGGGMTNLQYMVAAGYNFYYTARAIIPTYSTAPIGRLPG